ncbi:hypothetical protein HY408_00745 [Candidatus Gottesmanbacteria bacterium]|nr:hypothetical protein [Candidatus Gottesmanbacteria bacterium]
MKDRVKGTVVLIALLCLILTVGVVVRAQIPSVYNPAINPSDFSADITNPYFALIPGTMFEYKNQSGEGIETGKVVVTYETKDVMGVKTRVVWDRVWDDEGLIEETFDWYAQDKEGSVWYFGEESKEYDEGRVESTKGSWEAGVNGAKPGIVMKANPQVDDAYYQEYYPGEAEDEARVVAVDETVETSIGAYENCVKTEDFTKLEPEQKENKYYCPEVSGMVLAVDPENGAKEELTQVTRNVDVAGLTDERQAQVGIGETKGVTQGTQENQFIWMLGVGVVIGLIILQIGRRFLIHSPQNDQSSGTKE